MILAPAPVNLNEPLVLALARARARGESAYQVAARAQVHPSELSKWANGRRTPTPAQAERVAAVLGCQPEDVFPLALALRKSETPTGQVEASRRTDGDGAGAPPR